jgi:excisionase family DNA binding protein
MTKNEREGYRRVPEPGEAPGGRADLTPREYAALRRCTLATVYRRINAGCVTAYKLGGSTLITRDSVDAETARNIIPPKSGTAAA